MGKGGGDAEGRGGVARGDAVSPSRNAGAWAAGRQARAERREEVRGRRLITCSLSTLQILGRGPDTAV